MRPVLDPEEYAFALVERVPVGVAPFAIVREAEGVTVVLPWAEAARQGLADAVVSRCRRITLTVHSSLEAVGLTAAVSSALAARGISCNVIAGSYHDHLFVPAGRADDAWRRSAASAEATPPAAPRTSWPDGTVIPDAVIPDGQGSAQGGCAAPEAPGAVSRGACPG